MKFYLSHASTNLFNKFDVSKFRENCLNIDTMQFGCYFYFTCNSIYKNILDDNIKRFGKRNGNKVGYLYHCTIDADLSELIITNSKIGYTEFVELFNLLEINYPISKELYDLYDTNREIFYRFCKLAYKKWNDWQVVADKLISLGYIGYIDGSNSSLNSETFGTIVLFDTENIEITDVTEY